VSVSSRRVSSFLPFKKGGTEGFLNSLTNKCRNAWATLVDEYSIKEKSFTLIVQAFNALITGCLIWYAVEHRDIVSYGLLAALAQYYISWFVDVVRGTVKG
jgi:hypothetical protein